MSKLLHIILGKGIHQKLQQCKHHQFMQRQQDIRINPLEASPRKNNRQLIKISVSCVLLLSWISSLFWKQGESPFPCLLPFVFRTDNRKEKMRSLLSNRTNTNTLIKLVKIQSVYQSSSLIAQDISFQLSNKRRSFIVHFLVKQKEQTPYPGTKKTAQQNCMQKVKAVFRK